jgi:tetratricopeptide (TPR) repeat protein
MSKTGSDDLFQLIHSLSKSEKRHFKIFASRINHKDGKKFMQLFDLIHGQRQHDEDKVLLKAHDLNPAQLPNLKVNLYKQILLSVRLCNSAGSADVHIRSLIDNAQLLYSKCLYKQSMGMLDKAKKMAVEHDRDVLHLEVLEFEKTVLIQTAAADNSKRVSALILETKKSSRRIRNTHAFSNIALRLNSFYVQNGFIRNEKDLEKVEAFFMKAMPDYDEAKLSFGEKIYLYYCYTQYYYFIQDFERVELYAARWVDLFDGAPVKAQSNMEMYVRSLNYLLMAQNKLMKYIPFQATFKKLIAVKRNPAVIHTEHLNLIVVARLEPELQAFIPKLDRHYVVIFHYKIACLYFGADNHKRAIHWLNKIIQLPASDMRSDIASFARILALISHYELKNYDLIEYQIKSVYRYLLKNGDLGDYQKVILGFVRKLVVGVGEQSILPEFKKLRTALLKLKEDPFSQKAFVYFDIISWLDSKIENLPVQEVIRKKMGL